VLTPTNIHDTVRMPWTEELVVRPVLGILFRLALGARAEAWVPRFLRYERSGRPAIRWHWPAFLFPAVWAFYRRLWIAGGILAALPFGLAALFAWINPALAESSTAWLVSAFVVIWALPGVAAALAADSLLFRRVKREVREAEAASERKDIVAALLSARRRTAPVAALAAGGGMLALLLNVTVPELSVLYEQRVVRANVAAGLAAVAPLQRQVEEQWHRTGSIPRRPDYSAVVAQRNAAYVDTVDLSPKTGRVRLGLGPATGEIAGKVLLLAPTIDAEQRIHWQCIAVDVPAEYLPPDCRKA
jgi:pilin/uncharacterized protein DUF2628